MAKLSATAQDQPTTAPAQTMRQTRSMSAEPAGSVPPSSSKARAAQTKRSAGNKKSIGSASVNKKSRKLQTKAVPPELETVAENAEHDNEVDLQAQTLVEAETAEAEDVSGHRDAGRASVDSAMSGTTAKTSFSQEELDMLDTDVMVDELAELAAAADKLTQLLMPNGARTTCDTWKEIKRNGSKQNKLYLSRLRTFTHHKASFGTMPYIRPDLVLRGVLNIHNTAGLPPAQWRPDDILLRVNLAQMLNTLLIACYTTDLVWTPHCTDALQQLYDAYPNCIAGHKYSRAALEFYLNMTAQVVITHLEISAGADPGFSPFSVLDAAFFDGNGDFKHIDALGLSETSEREWHEAKGILLELFTELKRPFPADDGTNAAAAIGRLKNQFRWEVFQDHALRYAEARFAELEGAIIQAGGVAQILDGLGKEIERREEEKFIQETRRKSGSKGKRKSLLSNPVAKLLATQQDAEAAAASVPTLPSRPVEVPPQVAAPESGSLSQPQDADGRPSELSESPKQLQPPSSLAMTLAFQQMSRQKAAKQQKRLTDPQPDAQRIQFNDDEELQTQTYISPARPSAQFRIPGSSAAGKRKVDEIGDDDDESVPDPTQDQGFQIGRQDHAAAARRRQEVSFAQPPQRSSAIESASSVAGSSRVASSAPGPSPAKRQRKNPGSTIPPPSATGGIAEGDNKNFKAAKIEAAQNRVTSRARPTQIRRPWSEDEESTLIDLIEEHGEDGVSYAGIKAIDEAGDMVLSDRSGEDIRFKARNMKVTFLLAGRGLPKNWDKVVLAKRDIDKLHSRSIYYQQERQRHPLVVQNWRE